MCILAMYWVFSDCILVVFTASQELSAVYNDNGAHVGTELDARPQGQSWMLNASFISSLIRKTGA